MGILCVIELVVIVALAVAWRVAVRDADYYCKGWNDCVARADDARQRLEQELKEAQAAAVGFKLDRDEVRESTARLAANYVEASRKLSEIASAINS